MRQIKPFLSCYLCQGLWALWSKNREIMAARMRIIGECWWPDAILSSCWERDTITEFPVQPNSHKYHKFSVLCPFCGWNRHTSTQHGCHKDFVFFILFCLVFFSWELNLGHHAFTAKIHPPSYRPSLIYSDLGLLLILMKAILQQIHVHINLVHRDQVKSREQYSITTVAPKAKPLEVTERLPCISL